MTSVPTVTSVREYAASLGLLVLGSVGVLGTAALPWVTARIDDPTLGASAARVELSGTALAPALSPLALVALAAVVGVLASRGVLRRLVGVVVLLAGIGLVWLVGSARLDPAVVTRAARTATGTTTGASAESWTLAWLPALGCALLVCVAAALVVGRAGRWPTLSPRYDRDGAPSPGRGVPKADAWSQLDRGEDPTADASQPLPADPDLAQ